MEIRAAKGYWRRWRGYQRLEEGSGRKRIQVDLTRKKRIWKIKILPKLRILRKASPKRVFVWFRDAYVKMMLRLANSRVIGPSGYGGGGEGFGSCPAVKEYDEKMLVQIYKSILMAQENLVQRDAAKLCSDAGSADHHPVR